MINGFMYVSMFTVHQIIAGHQVDSPEMSHTSSQNHGSFPDDLMELVTVEQWSVYSGWYFVLSQSDVALKSLRFRVFNKPKPF